MNAQRAMRIVGAVTFFFGVGLAVAATVPGGLDLYQSILLPHEPPPSGASVVWAAVCGGLVAGVGVMVGRSGSPHVRPHQALLEGILVWFVVDSAASIGVGAWRNAVQNTAFLPLLAGPLWLSLRSGGQPASSRKNRSEASSAG